MSRQAEKQQEEAYAGKDLGSKEFVITDDLLGHYFGGLQISPDSYLDRSPYGRPVAPSMIVTAADAHWPGNGFKNSFGNLWIRQEWDLHRPLAWGEAYRATSKVLDIYEWRNRTVVKQEVTVWTLDGEIAARGRHHQSYLLDQDSGKVKLRDPKSKEGVRRFAVPDGEPIRPIGRTTTLEMCGEFFYGNRNYHNDKRVAEELGFENVVVGGRMTMSYLGHIMDERFGRGWYEGGRLDIKFTNIVWPDDHVTARGVITGRVTENGDARATVSLWMEKDDGTVVIVGKASALE